MVSCTAEYPALYSTGLFAGLVYTEDPRLTRGRKAELTAVQWGRRGDGRPATLFLVNQRLLLWLNDLR